MALAHGEATRKLAEGGLEHLPERDGALYVHDSGGVSMVSLAGGVTAAAAAAWRCKGMAGGGVSTLYGGDEGRDVVAQRHAGDRNSVLTWYRSIRDSVLCKGVVLHHRRRNYGEVGIILEVPV